MTIQVKRLVSLSLAASLAVATLYLSTPRLVSSLSYIPVDAALERHWEDYPIKQTQFPVLIEIAEKAIQKLDLAHYWQGLGWLYSLQVNPLNRDTPEGKKLLSQSQIAFETSLRKSPANPASWLRLAWIHAFLQHDTRFIVKTLKMSFYTGRAEHHLILNRLNLALRYTNYFEEDDLPLIRDQIQLAWRLFQARMLELIISGTFDKTTLLKLLADSHPELAMEMQNKL
ncbi:MAG: hypothetical protein ACI9J2_000542 [Saprospiraceae bacterium]|jgi:hypothetical protein